MGIWCVASNVGDVIGQYTAGALIEWKYPWEWIIIVSVVYMIISSIIFGFVKDRPSMVNTVAKEISLNDNGEEVEVVGVLESFKIPG